MSEELEILKLIAARLDAACIPYMVSGSIAMSYCAQPRMTRYIDIVVELTADDSDRVADVRNLMASVPDLDWPYIEQWAVDLTITDLLQEVRA